MAARVTVRQMARAAAFLLLLAPAALFAQSSSAFEDAKHEISRTAFDPATFFAGDAQVPPMLTIRYTGDDYAWPVYSIAVQQGCSLRGRRTAPACATQHVARMVRAPAFPNATRPRHRGSGLVGLVVQSGKPLPAALDAAGLDWVEVDLADCPAAASVFGEVPDIEWVPRHIYAPEPNELELVLHADTIEVRFDGPARRMTYHGYVAKGSPAAWAAKFAGALEPCWKKAGATPPWHRNRAALDE